MTRLAGGALGVGLVENRRAVRADAGTPDSPVDDATLSRRVAERIAAGIQGAKAGRDWWFAGWRVESLDNEWRVTVHADRGRVLLEGDVPRTQLMRKAVDAARRVDGVVSVESDFFRDHLYTGRHGHPPYTFPGYPHRPLSSPPGSDPYGYGVPGRETETPVLSPLGEKRIPRGTPRGGAPRPPRRGVPRRARRSRMA